MNPTKIMMIRHAEKPHVGGPNGVAADGTQDEHSLIVQGWQRAGALVAFFAPANGILQHTAIATPKYIFAANGETTAKSVRSKETVTPLASKLADKAETNFNFGAGQETQVAAALLQCNGVVLIVWEHHNIPTITSHFPISPNNKMSVPLWPDDRFDLVWVFDLDPSGGGYLFSQVPQVLLAGDGPV